MSASLESLEGLLLLCGEWLSCSFLLLFLRPLLALGAWPEGSHDCCGGISDARSREGEEGEGEEGDE